jgi:hypothetical protein
MPSLAVWERIAKPARSCVHCVATLVLAASLAEAAVPDPPPVAEIVLRAAITNAADWKAQTQYGHRVRRAKSKVGSDGHATIEQLRTYEIVMIGGSPYDRLAEVDGRPLTPAQEQQEQIKLKREVEKRQNESSGDRQRRLSRFERTRAEERLLMEQMTKAFKFRLAGEHQINGVPCYGLDAEPDPDYQPPVEKARVLTGMKGRLYIDKAQYHWVRVEAEVIKPVEFAFFLAKIKPGTRFELDQAPFGNVWLPRRFVQSVNASVLGFYGVRNKEEEIYTNYHQALLDAGIRQLNR